MIEYENLKKVNEGFFDRFKEMFDGFLKSGWYILAGNVKKFEEDFALYCGVRHCVGVASGLDALTIAIDACSLPKGSEIIVPSNTYIATILAVVRCGLKPVLVEPDIKTYNIDPARIEERINSKTGAIVAVHLYGKTCNMDPIMEIATRYNLNIIEDVAQAHGARYRGKMAGGFGIGCFSFYPTKNLGALGDAGAVLTDSDELADRVKALRNYGSTTKYHNDYIGYNSRLDEIQAGFLSLKLGSLDDINNHKRRLARIYFENLDERFIKPDVNPNHFDVYHIFNIRHPKRDEIREYLLKKGIKTEIHYPIPPHRQKAMKGIIEGGYPISEEIHRTTVSLPISYAHNEEDILKVCRVMNEWVTRSDAGL